MSTPSNKPSFRSRMGSLIRRSSLITSRPSSPASPHRKQSSTSISGGSTTSLGKDASTHEREPSRKSRESVREETRHEGPERLRPVSPTPAGVPSPIAEVESPKTPLPSPKVEQDAAASQVKEETKDEEDAPSAAAEAPSKEDHEADDAPSPTNADADPLSPRILEDDEVPHAFHDEPETVSIRRSPAQSVRFVEPSAEDVLNGPMQSPREETPYPSTSSSSDQDPEDKPASVNEEQSAHVIAAIPVPVAVPEVAVIVPAEQGWAPPQSEDPFADPFADPPTPISHHGTVGGFSMEAGMPEPQTKSVDDDAQSAVPVPVVQPSPKVGLDPFALPEEGFGSEFHPLLSNTAPVAHYASTSNGHSPNFPQAQLGNGHASSSQSISTISSTRYITLGWVPYILPNSRYYYVHPVLRATTDIELKDVEYLDAVMKSLQDSHWEDESKMELTVEVHLWASEVNEKAKGDKRLKLGPLIKIDHHRRFATLQGENTSEDDMDKEYRYWSFLERHPAHTVTVLNLHQDAVDSVCWSLSDSLLFSGDQAKSTPFSKAEAEHMLSLLQSFEDGARNGTTPSIAHTRLISRVFVRSLEHRQATQRPSKPLPTFPTSKGDTSKKQRAVRTSYIRGILTFLVTFLCLGIPVVFSRRTRFDEEAVGMQDTSTPSLMLGVSVCLVAAVLLSASVTFLSLPNLDSIPRIAIIIASLFASFAMVSTVFTIFRLKADLETAALWLGGGEDLLMISNRTILLSLPIVFLAYSIIAFVVGLVLYTFFSTFAPGGDSHEGSDIFGEYTRWIALGVAGALAGVFFATVVVLRG